jgi:hypothetical protein
MSNKKYVATDVLGLTLGSIGTLPVWDGTEFVNLPPGADGDALVADSTSPSGLAYAPVSSGVDPYLIINSGPPDSGFFGFPGSVLLAPEPGVVKQVVARYLPPTNSLRAGSFVLGVNAPDENVSLVLTPKGVGALQAQVADGTVRGGDARGTRAVDWQLERDNANEVASGTNATVGGGRQNRASGLQSTVAGGDNNTSSGSQSTIAGGLRCGSTTFRTVVGGGENNTAPGSRATVAGGLNNTASGPIATVAGGQINTVSGGNATVPGGERGLANRTSMLSHASGQFSTQGDAQYSRMILRRQTTDTTPTVLVADTLAPSTTNTLTLDNNSAHSVTVQVSARQNTTGDSAWWRFEVGIKRGANAAATQVVGPIFKTTAADAGASAWDVVLSADTTLGALQVEVTGEAGKTIRWVATLHTTKVQG